MYLTWGTAPSSFDCDKGERKHASVKRAWAGWQRNGNTHDLDVGLARESDLVVIVDV